ncbi:MAG: dCMP deaminase family protein [Acidobacteria bacterium]|nr:dCMP deaminase family protein [Acidobacteriota bacterium]
MKGTRARRSGTRSSARSTARSSARLSGITPRRRARGAASAATRRVDWHTYFMNIARQVASRSTCDRKHVGAVIVRDRTILSTGYNGSIRGMPHCDDAGHDLEGGHCVATIHAEANTILQAAKNGVMIEGAEIYTTASPCWNCFKLIANAGIRRLYYGEFYRDAKSIQVARRLGIELIDLGRRDNGK